MSALALGVALSAASVIPAQALSIIQPAGDLQEKTQPAYPASAFAAGKGEEGAPNGYALSEGEVSHIKWCAARYTSYHPTDNTYMASAGTRVQCRSPY